MARDIRDNLKILVGKYLFYDKEKIDKFISSISQQQVDHIYQALQKVEEISAKQCLLQIEKNKILEIFKDFVI